MIVTPDGSGAADVSVMVSSVSSVASGQTGTLIRFSTGVPCVPSGNFSVPAVLPPKSAPATVAFAPTSRSLEVTV